MEEMDPHFLPDSDEVAEVGREGTNEWRSAEHLPQTL
jgi:hypothetical protein